MKALYKGLGILAGLCLMIVLLFGAVEYVAYYKTDYYRTEYQKYDVADSIQIEMDELLRVTDEMMAYLRGDREDLVVRAEIADVEREFFNEKEKRHMVDVQGLFLAGMRLRRVAIICAVLVCGGLLLKKKGAWLFSGIRWGIAAFFAGAGVLVVLMMQDFNRYFTMFHLLFFDNDDWILNPETDLLINIVPEGFFRDTAFWIAGIFLVGAAVIWLATAFLEKKIKTGE